MRASEPPAVLGEEATWVACRAQVRPKSSRALLRTHLTAGERLHSVGLLPAFSGAGAGPEAPLLKAPFLCKTEFAQLPCVSPGVRV